MKGLLKIKQHVDYLAEVAEDPTKHNPAKSLAAAAALDSWKQLAPDDIALPLRQKGVDMRIGLDISTMTLKGQVDTIVLVTGDSDFVPAAKMARREGVEFILDPMWQSVNADLNEHVDGITSGFDRPGQGNLAIPRRRSQLVFQSCSQKTFDVAECATAGDPRGRSASGPWQLAERPEGNCLVGCHFK